MNNSLSNLYKDHHSSSRETDFSIMKAERGELIAEIVGTGKKMLDIGCRDGALTKYFTKDNSVLGVDIDENALSRARNNLGIETMLMDLNGDWDELGDRKFNAIVAGEVLEHLYYPEKITKKVEARLLPDGVFVGSVPNAFSLKNRLRILFGMKKHTPLSDPTHINQFHIEELREVLGKCFNKVEILGLGRYTVLAKMFPGMFAFDLFFICRK